MAAISFVGELATPLERVAPLVVQACREISIELYGDQVRRPRSGVRRRTGPGVQTGAGTRTMVSAG